VEGKNPSLSETPRKQPKVEVSHQTDGIDTERKKYEGPGSQPMVGPTQQEEVQIEVIKI
jgi:hypothetical protein